MGYGLNKLNARFVKTVKEEGRYADGGGLYLKVQKGGSKQWVLLFQQQGKRRELGLGSANFISLADARIKALELRKEIESGGDPEDRKKKIPLFSEVAENYIKDNEPSWKSPIHIRQWRQSLNDHASDLMNKQVDKITTQDVIDVLRPLWLAKEETAKRLRSRVEKILDVAKVLGYRTGENPAAWKGNLQIILPPQKKAVKHHEALPYQQAPAFFAKLRKRKDLSSIMMQLLILTASRSGEVRLMQWNEVDFKNKIWALPIERMKTEKHVKEPHRVPLSTHSIEILEALSKQKTEGFIFLNEKGEPFSNMVLDALLRRIGVKNTTTGVKITTHGFRSTFKDWADEQTNYSNELSEQALSHKVGNKVERAYRRNDMLEKRRALMQDWCDYLLSFGRV